jgi:hypothetical protein
MTVSPQAQLFGTSNGLMGTSLLGFRLDNILHSNQQVIFAVQLSYFINSNGQNTLATFDRVLVNVGNAWSLATSSFTAPYSGAYFFSFAAANPATVIYGVYLMVNGAVKATSCTSDGGVHNGVITARSAIMLQLVANDVVTIVGRNSENIYSSTDGLVNAQGFLYNLQDSARAVAWGLAASYLTGGVCTWGTTGPINIVSYNIVHVNIGGAWSTQTNSVTIPIAGTYFIDLSTYICGSGWGGNGNPRK